MRVVVIGAGIVGAHVAVELARRGAAVTVLDRGDPGWGTSGTSFAWIDASHPALASYLELRVRGLEAWRRAAFAFGDPPWLHLGGTLTWARAPKARRQLQAHAGLLDALGHPPARLSAAEARRREPDLVIPRGVDTVYEFPGEGWVLARAAIAALLDRGRAAGLRVRTGAEVRELIVGGRRITGVALGSGEELCGDVVVSCVGRWTQLLLGRAGVAVPMIAPEPEGSPAVGLVVRTTRARCRLRRVVCADGLVVRPDRDGRLALHSDAHDSRARYQPTLPRAASGSPPPGTRAAAEELLALVRAHVRGAEAARVEEARVCVRALPADGLPVVGEARDGLYVVTTHSGVTLAPALADLVARELIEQREVGELARFRPSRFEREAALG